MEKKRIVFDLDQTLLTADFTNLMNYFTGMYGDEGLKLYSNLNRYLDEYEMIFDAYKREDLSKFLTNRSGFSFTPSMIDDWNDIVSSIPDKIESGVIPLLEELSQKDKSLVVLTNWFRIPQLKRLEKSHLIEYFDGVISGEEYLKPHKDSYMAAKGAYSKDEVVFIGDNLEKDYIGPRACGMDSILYDKNNHHHENIVKVKRLKSIQRRV
ncbi:MAG: HAD family hydrolase [Bacilli bacterium]|nr:HAD family hydrolase [Bacilli bacterium]